jgi:HSP20 family protein
VAGQTLQDGYTLSAMTRRDKLTPESLQAEIEELFADLWQVPRFAGMRRGFRPNVDSFHTDDPHELTVVVEVPGVDPASLTIVVSERTLLIAGERARRRSDGRVYQQMEIEYGPFQRQIRLAEDVDPEKAQARYEHGIVTISLPVTAKPAPGQRHTIAVEHITGSRG